MTLHDTTMTPQPYTRGPCDFGEWFVFREGEPGGFCQEKKYCKRFDNWHWWSPHQRCYRQFTQVGDIGQLTTEGAVVSTQ